MENNCITTFFYSNLSKNKRLGPVLIDLFGLNLFTLCINITQMSF